VYVLETHTSLPLLISLLVASRDTTLIEDVLSGSAPELKGYLNKYANVARGWGTRWFVLKDGVLSCECGVEP
jgi:hypothetical protein